MKADKPVSRLTQYQRSILERFLTVPERNLSIMAVQYDKVLLVRTCYEKGTDLAFERLISRYGAVNFASICDDKDRYAFNNTSHILQCLPFLVETPKFARCSLMSKERQDKIIALASDVIYLEQNKIDVNKQLLTNNTSPAHEALDLLTRFEIQHWSSVVGVVCLVDQASLEHGLVKISAFNDQGSILWGSRISPKGLSDFMAGLETGKSVFELRHALRHFETGSGRRYSASEPSTKGDETPPSCVYDELGLEFGSAIKEKDRADTERAVTMASNKDLYDKVKAISNEKCMAEEAKDQAIAAAEEYYRKAGLSDCVGRDAVSAMRDAQRRKEHAETMCLTITYRLHEKLAVAREAKKSVEEQTKATESHYKDVIRYLQEELAVTKHALQGALISQEHHKASYHIAFAQVDQMRIQLATAMRSSIAANRNRIEHANVLSECIATKDQALKETKEAVLERTSLKDEVLLERRQVAGLQRILKTKELLIVGAEEHEKRMTERLREETKAKEEAINAENVLKAQLAQRTQTLHGAGQEIADLREQLGKETVGSMQTAKDDDQPAKTQSWDVAVTRQLTNETQEFVNKLQEMKHHLSLKEQSCKAIEDAYHDLEKSMAMQLDSKEQVIEELAEIIRKLNGQLAQEAIVKKLMVQGKQELESRLQGMEKELSAKADAHQTLGDQYVGLDKGTHTEVTCRERIIDELQYANRTLDEHLSHVVTAKDAMAQENKILRSSAAEIQTRLEAKSEAAEDLAQVNHAFEAKLIREVGSQELMIGKLQDTNGDLGMQLESLRAMYNQAQLNHQAANQVVSSTQAAKKQLEKDLQCQRTRRVEETKQARQEIELSRNAKKAAVAELKATKEKLEQELRKATAAVHRFDIELETTKERLTYNNLCSRAERRESERMLEQMKASMQEALMSKKSAELKMASWRDHFKDLYLEESAARVELEWECKTLKDQENESLEAVKKVENHFSEREMLLVGRLQAKDITARDGMARREQLEEELQLWGGHDGVIALD